MGGRRSGRDVKLCTRFWSPQPARSNAASGSRRRGRACTRRILPATMGVVPELPEVETWRRQLDGAVKAYPIEKAGPAHVATLKTFDPPLSTLDGEGFKGVERRGKRFLLPTDDEELVLMVHLMSAGRLRYLHASDKGPKTPVFRLTFTDGGQLVMTEAGSKKRAGVWLLRPDAVREELAHLGPEADDLDAETLERILASDSRRLHSMLRDQRLIAGIGRAWANEILHA